MYICISISIDSSFKKISSSKCIRKSDYLATYVIAEYNGIQVSFAWNILVENQDKIELNQQIADGSLPVPSLSV